VALRRQGKKETSAGSPAGSRSGLSQVMGELEAEVMECVWDLGSASVKDVHQRLLGRQPIAYTTVMTVMSRLATKGYLTSRPCGRAYIYEATADKAAFCTNTVREFLSSMLEDSDRRILANFVDSLTENDRDSLDLLAQIVEDKRRERDSSQSTPS
jgi:predicted transcriptional regulator